MAHSDVKRCAAQKRARRCYNAGNFAPSWAGAIAIDLLPAVLVLILTVVQAAIRQNEGQLDTEQTMTLADLEAARRALARLDTPPTSVAPAPKARDDSA